MPRSQRIILLVLAVVVVLVAVLVIPALTESGNESDGVVERTVTQTVPAGTSGTTATTPTEPPKPEGPMDLTIDVRDGKPSAGVVKLSYRKGETVNIVVTSDTTDEVHVHGYDITKNVSAGARTRIRFKADAEGIFEIEMHHSAQQIASLLVNPS